MRKNEPEIPAEYRQPNQSGSRQTGLQRLKGRVLRERGLSRGRAYISKLEDINKVRTVKLDDQAYRSLARKLTMPDGADSFIPRERVLSVLNIELFLSEYGCEEVLPSEVVTAIKGYRVFLDTLGGNQSLAWDKRLTQANGVFLAQEQAQRELWSKEVAR